MSLMPPGVELLGERIAIRLHDPEGGYRDIVGVLESETVVRKRDGTLMRFSPEDIAVWRKVELPPQGAGKGAPYSLRIREMEIAAALTWPPGAQEELGEWILRATGKFTMRANSVLVLGDPGYDLDDALERVNRFYAIHGLPSVIHIPLPTFSELDTALEQRGWILKTEALVMVTDINSPPLANKDGHEWLVSDTFDDSWLELQNDFGVSDIMRSAPASYAALKVQGRLAAVGRAANAGEWTVLTRLYVDPNFRNQGIGTELLSRLLAAAALDGATKALLQVDIHNSAAIRMYEKYGFSKHHSYRYRVAPVQENSGQSGINELNTNQSC